METSKRKKIIKIIVTAIANVVSVLLGISLESFTNLSNLIL